MNKFLMISLLLPSIVFAETWNLKQGKADYEVKHLMKKVSGESTELKGKIQCSDLNCDFLIAVPIKSFTSSDSNRDQNMLIITEAGKYPFAIASGKLPLSQLAKKGKSSLPLEIEFHGKKALYQAELNVESPESIEASVTIDLDQHSVDRPSLFGIKIEKHVPLKFKLNWEKKS